LKLLARAIRHPSWRKNAVLMVCILPRESHPFSPRIVWLWIEAFPMPDKM
jgi:hypothetical protein